MENKSEAFMLLGKAAKHIIQTEGHNETVAGLYRTMKQLMISFSEEEKEKVLKHNDSMEELFELLEKLY